MARVVIATALKDAVKKQFKQKAATIFRLMESLEKNPKKGKLLATIGNTALKELRYDAYRFFFVTDAYKVKFLSTNELQNLLIKFVRMANKKEQQKTIDEIKHALRQLGKF